MLDGNMAINKCSGFQQFDGQPTIITTRAYSNTCVVGLVETLSQFHIGCYPVHIVNILSIVTKRVVNFMFIFVSIYYFFSLKKRPSPKHEST